MKLTIERSGGLLPLKARAELDGRSLTRTQCRAVRTAFRAARAPQPLDRSDSFAYKLVLHGRGGSRVVRLAESAMPPELAQLVTR